MIDLLVVNPPSGAAIYGPLADDLTAIEPPLWSRIVAAWMRDRGFKVQILDAEAMRYSPKQAAVVAMSKIEQARLVCVCVYGHQPSASTQQMVGAGAFCRELESLGSAVPRIMIGGHPSALPVQTMDEEKVDFVGVGEGVLTVEGLLRGDDIAIIPGLVWRDGFLVRLNAKAANQPIEKLHGNAWDLLPMSKYRAHAWQCLDDLSWRHPYASIHTSLNCPYQCSFCCISAPFGDNSYRTRSPDDVAYEIEHLYLTYGVKTFKITDEMFLLNKRHYGPLCDRLIDYGFSDELNIWAYARIDTVDPMMLGRLRKAGFRWLALGIESGSAAVRDGANKKMKQRDIVEVVQQIKDAGINVIGNFIFGLPDDDLRTMEETFALAIECMPDFANFYSCMAYPGSALYRQAVDAGAELPETWAGYAQHGYDCRPLDTKHVDAATVLRFRDEAFRRFYSLPPYRLHVRKKFGEAALIHIDEMRARALPRRLLESELADA